MNTIDLKILRDHSWQRTTIKNDEAHGKNEIIQKSNHILPLHTTQNLIIFLAGEYFTNLTPTVIKRHSYLNVLNAMNSALENLKLSLNNCGKDNDSVDSLQISNHVDTEVNYFQKCAKFYWITTKNLLKIKEIFGS